MTATASKCSREKPPDVRRDCLLLVVCAPGLWLESSSRSRRRLIASLSHSSFLTWSRSLLRSLVTATTSSVAAYTHTHAGVRQRAREI